MKQFVGLLFIAAVAAGEEGTGRNHKMVTSPIVLDSASRTKAGPERQLRLYLLNITMVPKMVLAQAELVTAGIFANIGISIQWRLGAVLKGAEMPIEIAFDPGGSSRGRPNAMGYAMLHGSPDTRIHIFPERITSKVSETQVGRVLGHVMAHEIGHVLQGINRHSPSGVMKALWDSGDLHEMNFRPLEFANEDVHLIHQGLKLRTQRRAAGDAIDFRDLK